MENESTKAERIVFQFQMMALGIASGREELRDSAYNKAYELAEELVDAGH